MEAEQIRANINAMNNRLRDELARIAKNMRFIPLAWYEKLFIEVFDFFSKVGFVAGFLFSVLLIAPLGGIWEGILRGIDNARWLVVDDSEDEDEAE